MSDTSSMGFPEAAGRLGVSVRVLRGAIRAGRLPGGRRMTATASLSAAWMADAEAALKEAPGKLSGITPQKVPAFARYEGTSAWQKHRRRVRAYARFRAGAA